jgi:hypothetical protein
MRYEDLTLSMLLMLLILPILIEGLFSSILMLLMEINLSELNKLFSGVLSRGGALTVLRRLLMV